MRDAKGTRGGATPGNVGSDLTRAVMVAIGSLSDVTINRNPIMRVQLRSGGYAWTGIGGKGAPDLHVEIRGADGEHRCVWMECKAGTGELSKDQMEWHRSARNEGRHVYVVRSIDQAREIVASFQRSNAEASVTSQRRTANQQWNPIFVAVEGPDGAGKTKMVKGITQHYARDMLIHAPSYPKPPTGATPWSNALYYAAQREDFDRQIRREPDDELTLHLSDRWLHSGHVNATTEESSRMLGLIRLEASYLRIPDLVILLDAPDAVLDQRMASRKPPETPTEEDYRKRRAYRHYGDAPRVWGQALGLAGKVAPPVLRLNTDRDFAASIKNAVNAIDEIIAKSKVEAAQ